MAVVAVAATASEREGSPFLSFVEKSLSVVVGRKEAERVKGKQMALTVSLSKGG